MAKFKVLNTKNGKNTILTTEGLKLVQKDPQLGQFIEVIGEVDARGNLISDYKKGNFVDKSKSKKDEKN